MTCPICGKPTAIEWRPFCSRRCADVDLARWLGEGYRIAGDPGETPPAEAGSGGRDGSERPQ